MIATASLIVAGLLLAGWNYWNTCRLQQLLNRTDRQQDVIDRKLALIPSKSAPRTDGADQTPRVWLQNITVPDDDQLLDQPAKRRHAAPRNGAR